MIFVQPIAGNTDEGAYRLVVTDCYIVINVSAFRGEVGDEMVRGRAEVDARLRVGGASIFGSSPLRSMLVVRAKKIKNGWVGCVGVI